MGQFIDYDAIKLKLDTMVGYADSVQENLNLMDTLIQNSVGAYGEAWSGESAEGFFKSWDELAAELPGIIEIVKNQAKNVDNMLVMTKAKDTTSDGKVDG